MTEHRPRTPRRLRADPAQPERELGKARRRAKREERRPRGFYVKFNGDVVDQAPGHETWGVRRTPDDAVEYALTVYRDVTRLGDPDRVGGVLVYAMRGAAPGGTDVPIGRVYRDEAVVGRARFEPFRTYLELGL